MGSPDDRFWAEFLGVDPSDWASRGVSVREHVGLVGYHGCGAFAAGIVPWSRSLPVGLHLSRQSSSAANQMSYSRRPFWWSCSAVTSNG